MDDFCHIAKTLIKRGVYGHAFCSVHYFYAWLQRLQLLTEEKEVANDGEGEQIMKSEEELFEVDRTPLFNTRAPGNYQRNPRFNRLNHKSVVEQTVLSWGEGSSYLDVIDNVDYDAPGEVNSTDPRWTNPMSNIPRVLREERIYKRKSGEFGFKLFMSPEQKSTAWMKDMVQKFTKPGILVMDACAGTFSVAKACILFPKRRKFIECVVDTSGVTEAMPLLIVLNSQQVVSKASDINMEEEVRRSADVYFKAVQVIEVRKRLKVWEVPEVIPPMQTCSPHILYYLGTYFGREGIVPKGKEYSSQPVEREMAGHPVHVRRWLTACC